MRIALVFAALLSASCQKNTAPTETGSGSGSGSGSAAPKKTKSTLDITLPALSGKPPVKSTVPLTKAQLDMLGKIRFDDFELELDPYPASVAIRQRAKTKPRMSVNLNISPCTEKFVCRPMTLDSWKADEAALKKEMVDAEIIDRPDTTFEIGATSIAGAPAIFVYQAGQFFGVDEANNPKGTYSHSYKIFYNDGVNRLIVIVTYSDNPRASLAEMKRALPRAFFEKVAMAFVDYYGQVWTN